MFFDCEKFILKTIENCAPFVDQIYISYSDKPWSAYNKNAQNLYSNESNLSVLNQSKHFSKLKIIEGVWETEEQQREECRIEAIKDGMDYLIIQDADEFYTPENYKLNIDGILSNPDFKIYQCPWLTFWKSVDYVIVNREHQGCKNTIYTTNPLFAINLKYDNPFFNRRLTKNIVDKLILKGICFHLSYVLTDHELINKISTWGHHSEVNKYWYRYKWKSWDIKTKFINPFNGVDWICASVYSLPIPSEMESFRYEILKPVKLKWYDRAFIFILDFWNLLRYYYFNKKIKPFLKKGLKNLVNQ